MPSPCQMERWTPLMVARSWHRNELGVILTTQQENQSQICPSPYISIPFMSIVKIARIVLLILGVPGVIGLGSRGSERDDRGRDRKGHKDDARDESRRGRDGHSSDREERYRGTADGFFLLYLLLFLFIVFQFICINASLTKFL
nr:uncharacterized protein LOC118051586 [Populus alba]